MANSSPLARPAPKVCSIIRGWSRASSPAITKRSSASRTTIAGTKTCPCRTFPSSTSCITASASRIPEKSLWQAHHAARQVARSEPAELHSSFQALRGAMPINIRSRHPGKGMSAESRRDIDRVVAIWSSCRERFGKGGAMLFGRFSIADAYYAPVVTRFQTYAVPLPRAAQAYCDAVLGLGAVRAWMDDARRETDFVPGDEPYASGHR